MVNTVVSAKADLSIGSMNDEDAEEYLTFYLNSQEYGIEILKVQGIQGWAPVTKIPNTPEYVLGVINLRGAIVPVVDLRKRFLMPEAPFDNATVVIVVKIEYEGGSKIVGLVVDSVSQVRNISDRNYDPAPDFGSEVDTDFVKGLARVDEDMVILLEIDKLVSAGLLGLGDGD